MATLQLMTPSPKLLTYDHTIQELFLYNLAGLTPNKDHIYIIQIDSKRLRSFRNAYLKVQLIHSYFQTNTGNPFTVHSRSPTSTRENALVFGRFKILSIYYTLEKALSGTKLKGFSRVIDDNDYFAQIPLINQLSHFDNGVFVSAQTVLTPTYDPDITTKWDKFKLSHTTLFNGKEILKMTSKGHIEV